MIVKPTFDIDFISCLGQYVASGSDCIRSTIAKFLGLLTTEATLEASEIDNLIIVNGETLSQWYVVYACVVPCRLSYASPAHGHSMISNREISLSLG